MTVRQHLIESHKTHAEFHKGMAQIHRDHIGKADGFDVFHKAAAEHHDAYAAKHEAASEACQKAVDSGDLVKRSNQVEELQAMVKAMVEESLNEVLPSPISKLAPTAPTLVPRHGQPNPVTKAVPKEFSRLVAVDEDDERAS
jgi:hypothetical protein